MICGLPYLTSDPDQSNGAMSIAIIASYIAHMCRVASRRGACHSNLLWLCSMQVYLAPVQFFPHLHPFSSIFSIQMAVNDVMNQCLLFTPLLHVTTASRVQLVHPSTLCLPTVRHGYFSVRCPFENHKQTSCWGGRIVASVAWQ